ncbi:class I SAM-dependent methyltransferase [Methylobacterium sp. WL103]|uniref:class I SAM-dependent methyltransferase n=1 Tax=Methylobacterium sp. WL103 TaxID=2603891 RepID=UPI0011C93345|nr:class I SAM-dependent methyltransferase [Methylobacterium sp. WL103]TXN04130.1 class I SAM-dependent methyltransferase [Methylobacterium sp. WL103]
MAQYYNRVQGENYYSLLQRFHRVLEPATYLEIGSRSGESVALSACSTIAIDPGFNIASNVIRTKPTCHFYQCTSDHFFSKYDPTAIFGQPIDMAFLDGMHLSEFLLRDFYNTERHSKKNSVVMIHDCLPGEELISLRSSTDPRRESAQRPDWWTGDVWKILPVLKKHRNDLKIIAIDADPTGLICITNLNPSSNVLRDDYNKILTEMNEDLDGGAFDKFWSDVSIVPTSNFQTKEDIWKHFWI